MSKVGKIFKGFFKVIFTSCAIVAGALVFAFLGLEFVSVTSSVSALGSTSTSTTYVTGYALSFKGSLLNTIKLNDNISGPNELGQVGMSVGILIAFILLCIALVLALIYLVCAWGKKSATLKKIFGFGSSLCFLVCGILFFCAVPLSKGALSENTVSYALLDQFKLGVGAIFSGIFAILASLFSLIAAALGPKKGR